MKVGDHTIADRELVSIPLIKLAKIFEANTEFWAAYEVNVLQDRSRAFRLSHEVSSSKVWDCGLVVFRRLYDPPDLFRERLQREVIGQEVLDLWTEVLVLYRKSMNKDEFNHLQIIINDFFGKLPPNTLRWSIDPPHPPLWKILREFDDENWRTPLEMADEVILTPITRENQVHKAASRGRGRSPLTDEEITQRRKIVAEVEEIHLKTGKSYREIAGTLDIPYRRLQQWRHDYRITEP